MSGLHRIVVWSDFNNYVFDARQKDSRPMENSQFETPKPSQTPFTFPPHRRRHLKSETYRTLVRILSHCNDESQCSQAIEAGPEEPIRGQVTESDELAGHDRTESENLFVQGPDRMGSENLLVLKESVVDENREVIVSQDKGFSYAQMEIDGLDHMNVMEGNEEHAHDNSVNLMISSGDKSLPSGGAVVMINSQEDHFTDPIFHTEEFGPMWKLEVDKELSSCKVSEVIDSSLDIDMIAETSKPSEFNEEKRYTVEGTVSEQVENELQLKEMELEKLLFGSGVMNDSLHVLADEEIEEGEIFGDVGVFDESADFLPEDVVALKVKKVEEVQLSKDIVDKEELTCDEQNGGLERDTECTPFFVDAIDNASNVMEVELRESIGTGVEDESKMIVHGKTIEAKEADAFDRMLEAGSIKKLGGGVKKSDHTAACPENLAPHGKISGENTTENQSTASTEKLWQDAEDAGVFKKKKKRGPPTKEKRAKKKRKERIKRAEENRRLGVKRLKLPPVLKPKTITYCRHYLMGRCQEGEKCKFSHDTIPLTKSKPCCHFARHSCMKGDDCPFDHQLSKYPCNNYLSKGSCGRGADCMFSHEIPVKEDSPIPSNDSKPELNSHSLLVHLSSKKQLNVCGTTHQNTDVKSCSTGISPWKKTEQHVAEPILKPATQAPKGISFLLHGKSSLGDASMHKQASSSPKADDGVTVGHQMIHSASDVVQNSMENRKRTPAVAPQGINFLSFGKAPLDDSSSKKSSGLPFNKDYGNRKSPLCDASKGKQIVSSLKRDDGVKVDNQNGQSASDSVRNLNEMANGITPAVLPRGINFLSFGETPLDYSKKQASLHSNADNGVPSTVQKNQSVPDKLKVPEAVPWKLPSSPITCTQSSGKLIGGRSDSTPSSSQKSLVSNTPSSMQKALWSTLAFAAKFESEIKMDRSIGTPAVNTDFNKEAGSSQNKLIKASTILDFLYSDNSKTKQ